MASMRTRVYDLAERVGVNRAFRLGRGGMVKTFLYHNVGDDAVPHPKISSAEFETQLVELKAKYNIVRLLQSCDFSGY